MMVGVLAVVLVVALAVVLVLAVALAVSVALPLVVFVALVVSSLAPARCRWRQLLGSCGGYLLHP